MPMILRRELQKHSGIYTTYIGGAGALAADCIQEVQAVYWLEKLDMAEVVWILEVNDSGPPVVAIDSHGKLIYR